MVSSDTAKPTLSILSGVVIAIVAAAVSGYFASLNVEKQVAGGLRQADAAAEASARQEQLQTRAIQLEDYLAHEAATWTTIESLFKAAAATSRGGPRLEDSALLKDSNWNPQAYRLSLSDFPNGRTLSIDIARLRSFASASMLECVGKLQQLKRVALYEISYLAQNGTFEWFADLGLTPTKGGPMDDLGRFFTQFGTMRSDIRTRLIDMIRAFSGLERISVQLSDTSCVPLPTHIRGSSTECSVIDGFPMASSCKTITLEQLRAEG